MRRAFLASELDTTASWWRIYRCDGVTLGFTTHDRDLWFDGIVHRAAPGMLPSAIRRTLGFEDDPSDVTGALSHDAIRAPIGWHARSSDALPPWSPRPIAICHPTELLVLCHPPKMRSSMCETRLGGGLNK